MSCDMNTPYAGAEGMFATDESKLSHLKVHNCKPG